MPPAGPLVLSPALRIRLVALALELGDLARLSRHVGAVDVADALDGVAGAIAAAVRDARVSD